MFLAHLAGAYRFELRLPANGAQDLNVEQEQLVSEEVAVTNTPPDFLIDIVQNKSLSEAGHPQLRAIVSTSRRTNRLRQNIDSLNRVKGQEDQARQYFNSIGGE